jgi:hypothetical protein
MPIKFTATIRQFEEQGEKTGWTHMVIPAEITDQLKPGNKKSFRVKGLLDHYPISNIALLPMGDGSFIMPVNAAMRKGTGKRKGALVQVQLELDTAIIPLSADLLACLGDEPDALASFEKFTPSHQRYFSNWIESAKTELTKTKRLVIAVNALKRCLNYSQMLREQQGKKIF